MILDEIRKKWLICTPEEWVRQHAAKYFHEVLGHPSGYLHIEKGLTVLGLSRRADIIIYNQQLQPSIIVECKAPKIKLTNEVFEQAARYNITMKVPYLVITNGLDHHCAFIDQKKGTHKFMDHLPTWEEIQ